MSKRESDHPSKITCLHHAWAATGDPAEPWACEHCGAVGDECPLCFGDGEGIAGDVCDLCDGDGVVPRHVIVTDADDPVLGMDLGPCCACEEFGPSVRNIGMLDVKGQVPGRGWGCFVCGLPPDGAVIVLCDRCVASGAEVRFACRGRPGEDGRVPIGELTEPHHHDMSKHAGEVC